MATASPQPGNRDERERDAAARAACLANWPDAMAMGYHPSCCRFPKSCSIPPAPSAGQDTGQLRDELVDEIAGSPVGSGYYQSKIDVDEARDIADALLDGPLARLIAERDEARAQVRAVHDLHVPLDRGTGPQCQGCATHITFIPWPCATIRALDGPQRGDRP